MRRITTRLISAALAVSMMLSVCPVGAFATGGAQPATQAETTSATEVGPVISGSYTIDHGGTYNLLSGDYTTTDSAIVVNTTDAVMLNITGNITASSSTNSFIQVTGACQLTINGVYNNITHTVSQTGGESCLFNNNSAAVVTFHGGIYEGTTASTSVIMNNGTINTHDATFRVTGTQEGAGQVFGNDGNNHTATLNIYSGTVIDNGSVAKCDAIAGGVVNMYGGTITAGAKASAAIAAQHVTVTGGTIQNSLYGIKVDYSQDTPYSAKIDGTVNFVNNTEDIHLAENATFGLTTAYTSGHRITVGLDESEYSSITAGTSRTLIDTTQTQIPEYKVVPAAGNYAIRWAEEIASGKTTYSLALVPHTHHWQYTANDNTLTAVCTLRAGDTENSGNSGISTYINEDISFISCAYDGTGIAMTLKAPAATVEGETDIAKYSATVENGTNFASVTGQTVTVKYKGTGDTTYEESTTAPTAAGTYQASVTVGSATAAVSYTIAPKTYNVTVKDNKGTANPTSAATGETVTVTPNPAETGYKLSTVTAKTTGENGTDVTVTTGTGENAGKYTFTMPEADVEVTVTYVKEKYTLTTKVNGLPDTEETTDKTEQVEYGAAVSKTAQTVANYDFTGWTASSVPDGTDTTKPEISFTMPAGAVTLTANYKQRDYNVTAVNGTVGDNGQTSATAHYGDSVTFTANTADTGASFKNWTFKLGDADYTFDSYENGNANANSVTVKMPAGNLTATAHFTNNNYTVTVTTAGSADKTQAEYNNTITLTRDPSKDPKGHKQTGWTLTYGGTTKEITEDSFQMPDADVSVAPKYDYIDYKVTVYDGDTTNVVTETAHIGQSVSIPAAKGQTGHALKEWKATGLSSETIAADAQTITVEAADVTLTAVYAANLHSLTVITADMGDDGTSTPFGTEQNLRKEYNESVTLPAEDVEGKIFVKWTVEGVAGLTESTGKELTFPMPDGDVTVTAHYQANEPVAPSAPGSSDGGAGAGVVIAIGAGVAGYELGIHLYRKYAMHIDYWPKTRLELATLLWEKADQPEPASTELFEDMDAADANAQKAARWCVEQGLITVREEAPAQFRPGKAVTHLRVCLTWHDAQQKGLIQ